MEWLSRSAGHTLSFEIEWLCQIECWCCVNNIKCEFMTGNKWGDSVATFREEVHNPHPIFKLQASEGRGNLSLCPLVEA